MISGSELFMIFFAILLLFGAKSIPEVAKNLGKGYRELKKISDDIKKDISDNINVSEELNDFKNINDKLKG